MTKNDNKKTSKNYTKMKQEATGRQSRGLYPLEEGGTPHKTKKSIFSRSEPARSLAGAWPEPARIAPSEFFPSKMTKKA